MKICKTLLSFSKKYKRDIWEEIYSKAQTKCEIKEDINSIKMYIFNIYFLK